MLSPINCFSVSDFMLSFLSCLKNLSTNKVSVRVNLVYVANKVCIVYKVRPCFKNWNSYIVESNQLLIEVHWIIPKLALNFH